MSLRLASFAALAALGTVVASGACTSTITLVDTTSTTGTSASTSAGTGGGSSSAGSTGSGTGGSCSDACASEGATRCTANTIQTCTQVGSCLAWSATTPCPETETCDSTATKCIDPAFVCDDSFFCGCNCECVDHQCLCTGALPPTCTTDADCGPVCAGLLCVDNQCVLPK